MEETLEDHEKSLAAPIIFVIVLAFQFLTKFINHKKKRGAMSEADRQLRAEIKQLLKEANSLSQPSTFAQATKLRRMAAAKEKELAKTLRGMQIKAHTVIHLHIVIWSSSFNLKGSYIFSTDLVVLEDACGCYILATSATLWEDSIVESWRSLDGQCLW